MYNEDGKVLCGYFIVCIESTILNEIEFKSMRFSNHLPVNSCKNENEMNRIP